MKTFATALLLTSFAQAEAPLKNPIPEPEAQYWTTDLTVIPKESSDGFAYKVKNSTFKRKNDKLYMEFGLTVEGPPQELNSVYMMYFQILDPKETERLERNYYESLACSLLYTDTIIEDGVHIQNSVIAAYRGEEIFKDAEGRFDKLLANNKSNTFPWFINYRRSKVTTSETEGTTTCNIYRDFETTWTEI